jgi:hyperosmotically inducible protein
MAYKVNSRSVAAVLAACALTCALSACGKNDNTPQNPNASLEVKAPAPKKPKGAPVEDSVVTTRVQTALHANAALKGLELAVSTKRGTVELRGTVDNIDQWSLAVDVANVVDGVDSVNNQLNIKK